MSRIGRMPISVPSGVSVDIDGSTVTVKGPKGTLTHQVAEPITITKAEDGTLEVARPNDERQSRSLHGLTRTLVNNMVVGVTDGYSKALEISGTGYRVVAKGSALEFSLGYSHPVVVDGDDQRVGGFVDDTVDAGGAVRPSNDVLTHRHPGVAVDLARGDPGDRLHGARVASLTCCWPR